MEEPKDQIIDPEVITETALVKPAIPVTVDELANLEGDAGEMVVLRRHKIVDSMRRASIALTSPQDWLLFKAEDRRTAFLQDSGCQRIMALWGIEITPVGGFEMTTVGDDPEGEYAITCRGDAYCHVTDQTMKGIEGTRYSDEDFCSKLNPIRKKIRVQQAAVANRNGNAVRKLTGLSNVAVELLELVWKEEGKGKSINLCALGKGYGSRQERQGANMKDGAPSDIKPPICDICGKNMKYVSGTDRYPAFWSCPDKKKGPDGKYNNHGSVEAAKWAATMKLAEEDKAAQDGAQ